MSIYLDDGDVLLRHGDARTELLDLPAGIAQTCVTSPPYYALRDYQTATWTGGDPEHDHAGQTILQAPPGTAKQASNHGANAITAGDCSCGARRVDNQIGLEQTPDEYVDQIVQVMRGVRHVLRDDGTAWIVIGDSYSRDGGTQTHAGAHDGLAAAADRHDPYARARRRADKITPTPPARRFAGAKPKDLLMVPAAVALALRADGWYLRAEIIWDKPNPMPESVEDRPSKADERILLLAKSERYFYDGHAIREPAVPGHLYGNMNNRASWGRMESGRGPWTSGGKPVDDDRNARSVWRIATQPFPGAHFATYPQDLVARCIRAGTSEHGSCGSCGAPWRRIVELVGGQTSGRTAAQADAADDAGILHARYPVNGSVDSVRAAHVTRGWEPTCRCSAGVIAPQIVVDPFMGSGTTAVVARRMGRHALGIDLNAEYLQMASDRLAQRSLLT